MPPLEPQINAKASSPLEQAFFEALRARDLRRLALIAIFEIMLMVSTQALAPAHSSAQRYGIIFGCALSGIAYFAAFYASGICDWPLRPIRAAVITLLSAAVTYGTLFLSILMTAYFGAKPIVVGVPVLAALLLIKWPARWLAAIFGRAGEPPPQIAGRVGGLVMLACANIIAAALFWYPLYVSTHNSAPDDRYGFLMLFMVPCCFLGGGLTAYALVVLLKTTLARRIKAINVACALLGVVLAIGGFSPLFMLVRRLISLR